MFETFISIFIYIFIFIKGNSHKEIDETVTLKHDNL